MSKPETETEMCRAVKHGGVDLHCTLSEGHDGWHMADFVIEDKRIVRYDGSRHEISTDTHEHVEWEPVDAAREAVRALLRDSKRARGE